MAVQYLNINTIDECVDSIIENFYSEIIEDPQLKKENLITYIKSNFGLLKEKTMELINRISKTSKINKIITTEKEYNKIISIFFDYTMLYLFFTLSKTAELITIINLLNNLSKTNNDDFFKNKYLAQYDTYYKYIKDYHLVFNNIELVGIKTLKENNEYLDIIKSIEQFDTTTLNMIIEDKLNLTHNIVKVTIFREIYIKEDKLLIYKLLETEEFSNAEYKYIDVIDSKYDTIDYATIESLFSIKDIKEGLAEEIFQMITDYEMTKFIRDYTIESKINQLFTKKIIIPITDEFLRYHKESELYDKNIITNIDVKERSNKKDNTKIKYIISRVNKVKDYYTSKTFSDPILRADIEKIFYQPMLYRKAIIINDIEEINILRKLEIQGTSVIESNEYYGDLKQLRNYPYIEFRTTKNDSFNFKTDNTIQTLRYCNFEYKNDPKFPNIGKTELQYRVINKNTKTNIVGIAIPKINPNIKKTNIGCYKVENTMDMSSLYKNAFAVCIKKLRKIFLEDKKYSNIFYWLFNTKNDIIKINLFDNIKQLPKDDYIKLLLGNVYDEMVDITYQSILKEINNTELIDILNIKKIISKLESTLVLIPRESTRYAELNKLIYYLRIETTKDTYDKNEDNVNPNLIRLPRIVLEKIAIHIINISKKELTANLIDDTDIYEDHLCQHTITWNNLLRLKKNNPNKFNQELFNFIKKYVIENKDKDFICKSCYQLVDLSKYTTEIYPGSDSIAVSYSLETELETIYEYTKYTKAIKNMDKMIERITYSANISYYVGSNQETKFRRQEIIKMVIDLIEIQYKVLYSKDTARRNERSSQSIKKYGCSMTNFFLFKLDNDIFTYSSKEIDKFKLFKMNNILTYMLINIIIEINQSQILNLTFDKLVNYFLFTKFGFNLFDNLYIRISNKNDIAPIKNYKLLCYIIYYISGIYAKLNMWYSNDIPSKLNHINPQIQKLVIHTFIDCLNSILEINTKENKNYIYNVITTKFFNKLNYIYNNNTSVDIISKLDADNVKKVIITSDKKLRYNISTVDAIPYILYNDNGKFLMESTYGIHTKIAPYPNIKFVNEKLKESNILDIIGESKLNEIKNNLLMDSLYNIATLYNTDGLKRATQITIDDAKKIKLETLKQISEESCKVRIKNVNKLNKKLETKMEKINILNLSNLEYLKKLKKKINIEINDVISKFINKLQSLIGKDININNSNYYLDQDIYEINHDYRGNKKTSIFIKDIKIKKNDSFFKQDVYYHEDNVNHVTIYYSLIERYLIGYKENSKDYVMVKNTDCYLKINYSIYNQLKYLGFNYINYKINLKTQNINSIINNIFTIRLQNLKNSISLIQQIIYQIKNNFNGMTINPIAKRYQNKIKSIETYNSDGERIFKDWNILTNTLFHTNINIDTEINTVILPNTNAYITTELLLKFITNDDILLYYIIEQFSVLLDINTNTYIKNNIAYLIINIILQIFKKLIKSENINFDMNVKIFYYYITRDRDVSESNDEIDYSNMSEEEIEKLKEEKDIDNERLDALDADQDETNEDFGDEDVLLHDRSGGEY
jgi:hypothetical protein